MPELWPIMRMFQIVGLTLHHHWRWMIRLGYESVDFDPLDPEVRRQALTRVMTPAKPVKEADEAA
jgi:hypothetical protein